MQSYEEQLSAAKYKAERDLARQEVKELREKLDRTRTEMNDLLLEIEHDNQRLMPEGYEWPRYEDGSPVVLSEYDQRTETISSVAFVYDDAAADYKSPFVEINPMTVSTTRTTIMNMGDRVKRPQVLAADGEPIEIGDKVWNDGDGPYTVENVEPFGTVEVEESGFTYVGSELTHEPPVLDADGVPINEGDTVYFKERGEPITVVNPLTTRLDQIHTVECDDGFYSPEKLTHNKPEPPDSWEQIEKDAVKDACEYFGYDDDKPCKGCPAFNPDVHCLDTMVRDIINRCKKLAGKEGDHGRMPAE